MTHVLVIGGGPAGLAAASAALSAGARVTVLDSAADVGGQFWRHLPAERAGRDESRLHHKWDLFLSLREVVRSRGELVCEAQVWSWEPGANAPGWLAMIRSDPTMMVELPATRLPPGRTVRSWPMERSRFSVARVPPPATTRSWATVIGP